MRDDRRNKAPVLDATMGGWKNRMPGAVVTRNSYVAGEKFMIAKNAPDRDVKKSGSRIADEVYGPMKERGLVPP